MSASPTVRGLRAAVFAAVCVLLAAVGHGLAMGRMPSLGCDGAGFLAVFALGWALGARERSGAGIGAVMLLTQAGLHLGFAAAQGGFRTACTGSCMPGMPGMAGPTAHAAAAHNTAHATAAHLLAALAASWWLRRGEAALWSLLRRTAALVPALLTWWRPAPLPATTGLVPRDRSAHAPPRRAPLRHPVTRRGPPVPIPYPL
ncbi:hypothetical protein [Streptomyces malaysiense]|uniref:Uncharacterized protein n=1 Tax=Streptomyces malaysiense TaxID=1428626 RepID=A0A1J4Q478_9ACTN|nr:hypothetical protein [Streptomyces malaysiense]OIK26896.1 hypothetical protein VT52_014525 [Streptomyces malaysiense]